MNRIFQHILKAKHWQVFLVLVAIPYLVGQCFSKAAQTMPAISENHLAIGLFIIWQSEWMILSTSAWYWAVGTFLKSIAPPNLQMSTRFFRMSLLYPAVFMPVVLLFMLFTIPDEIVFTVVIFLLGLFFCCEIYALFFISKCLMSVEIGALDSFYYLAWPFFLFMFYPIGIWFIQPKINFFFEESKEQL